MINIWNKYKWKTETKYYEYNFIMIMLWYQNIFPVESKIINLPLCLFKTALKTVETMEPVTSKNQNSKIIIKMIYW